MAQETDEILPPPTPAGQWRYITQEDAASSSHCIGQPDRPICAVETLLACFQRNQIELCRMVDDGTDQYAQVFSQPADPGKYLAYRILAASRLNGSGPKNSQTGNARAGDVLLTVDQREGQLGRYARATGAPAQDFLLRRQADGYWKIVSWGDPGENLSQ